MENSKRINGKLYKMLESDDVNTCSKCHVPSSFCGDIDKCIEYEGTNGFNNGYFVEVNVDATNDN